MSPLQGEFCFPAKSLSAVTPLVVTSDSTDSACGRLVVVPFTSWPFTQVWPLVMEGLVYPLAHHVVAPG